MKMVIAGQTIGVYAQRAAAKKINEQIIRFTSAPIAAALLPYVRDSKGSWFGWRANTVAHAAAKEVLRLALARKELELAGRCVRTGEQYYKRVTR